MGHKGRKKRNKRDRLAAVVTFERRPYITRTCIACLRPAKFYDVTEVALDEQFCNKKCRGDFATGWVWPARWSKRR